MNINPKPGEEALDKSLREWRVNAALPPRFQDEVWRRIERERAGNEATLWQALRSALERLAARRQLAVSFLALTLVVGLALGYWQARARVSSLDSSLGQRYVQSLDPYLKSGHL